MTRSLYAIVPVTVGMWSQEGELTADCLNDLHSFDKELLKTHGFRPYHNNNLPLRTTADPQYSVDRDSGNTTFEVILVDVGFFRQCGFCIHEQDEFIVLKNLTAERLLEIASEVHRKARET